MPKLRKLGIPCPLCGQELNSWDNRASRALGYLHYQVCESCLCKEYGKNRDEFRDILEEYFGMRPCKGI